MFWQDDDDRSREFQVPDEVQDLQFGLSGREIPVDHLYMLSRALRDLLPWLEEEPLMGIHSIHVAGSQNGWERPEHSTAARLLLSRRTKFTLRTPKHRLEQLQRELEGQSLTLDDCVLTLGKSKPLSLSKQTVIHSRYVCCEAGEEEEAFLQRMAGELQKLGVRCRKALCGKVTVLHTPEGEIVTRSLMLADMSAEDSVRLQQHGLGPNRLMGCGIFLPHKGIDAVKQPEDE